MKRRDYRLVDFGDDEASALHSRAFFGERIALGPGWDLDAAKPDEEANAFAQMIGEEGHNDKPQRSARDIRLWRQTVKISGVEGWEPEPIEHILAYTNKPGKITLPALKTLIPAPKLQCWEPKVLIPAEGAKKARAKKKGWGWQVRLPLPPIYAFDREDEHEEDAVERGCWMAKFRRYKIEREALRRVLPRVRIEKGEFLDLFSPTR